MLPSSIFEAAAALKSWEFQERDKFVRNEHGKKNEELHFGDFGGSLVYGDEIEWKEESEEVKRDVEKAKREEKARGSGIGK